MKRTLLFFFILLALLASLAGSLPARAQGCTDGAGNPIPCPPGDSGAGGSSGPVYRFLGASENYLDPANWNNGRVPTTGENALLDGKTAVIDPRDPASIPLGNVALRNNARLIVRDAVLQFDTLDSEGSTLEIFNSYIKAKTFIDPPWGGFSLNPSFLEADRIVLYKEDTIARFGLGGDQPATPEGRGAGHYARMQGGSVDLDGQLELFLVYGFLPDPGDTFEIVNVTSRNPIRGTFANAPEGAALGGFCNIQFRITYKGGDGNDVVLTAEQRADPDSKCGDSFADPRPEKNILLDASSVDLRPDAPLEVNDILLRNGATWNLHDGVVTARVVDSFGSSVNLFGSYLKADVFIDPGVGGFSLNPSLLEADRIVIYKPETVGRFGLGGDQPATSEGRGAGHYARMQGNSVDLGGQLEVFLVYGFMPDPGDTFEIINNAGSFPIRGEFVNASEGGVVGGLCSIQFRITYQGGDGNDVVLTAEQRTDPDPKCSDSFTDPRPDKNVFLDGASVDIQPDQPVDVNDIFLRNGATWNLHDGSVTARVVDSSGSSINLFGSYLKADVFIDPGFGGYSLNPSLLEANRIVIYKPETVGRFGFGGDQPATPEGRGAGHYARMQGNSVDLGGQLEIFLVYGFLPDPGDTFEIVSNTGNSPIRGEFVNAPEGGVVGGLCSIQFRVTYQGGDGNDVVLTAEKRTDPDPKCSDSFENANAEQNVFLDGASVDLTPAQPVEVNDIFLRNGTTWNLHDGVVTARVVDSSGSFLNLFNSYLKVDVFVDPIGGFSLNPSFLEANRVVVHESKTTIAFGLGGTEPAGANGLGKGHYAHMQTRYIRLDGTFEVFFVYGFKPQAGQVFQIVTVEKMRLGEFINAPEGAVVGGYCDVELVISYVGGDGNDVVLTAQKSANPDPAWECDTVPQPASTPTVEAAPTEPESESPNTLLFAVVGVVVVLLVIVFAMRRKAA